MYLSGFGNYHQSEAIEGALPKDQNSPQICPGNLYAEQISGSAFTKARSENLYSWVYRLKPLVVADNYKLYDKQIVAPFIEYQSPDPLRWLQACEPKSSFLDSLFHIAGHKLANVFTYNFSDDTDFFKNNDGEFLIVPYQAELTILTEMGIISVSPGMIAIIPRGIIFKIKSKDLAAGYICENKGAPLRLPELGIIGANGLANPRHFLYPTAEYFDEVGSFKLICKNLDTLWVTDLKYNPLNVVAWQGRYAPYIYDLSLFNTINTVSFDHIDPSIFTVLTSPGKGVANLDFIIFPPRWQVAENTFRPPYFHRNIMNELLGLIKGNYDARSTEFEPGAISIHNCMTPHGPDFLSHHKASHEKLSPKKQQDNLAFMFESDHAWRITKLAAKNYDKFYLKIWDSF